MKIRYHHLMCIPRFRGEGYSKEFCENMKKVKACIRDNNYVLVEECDDICSECPNNIHSQCLDEQKVKRYDAAVKKALKDNIIPQPKDICSDCKWFYICRQ